MCNSRRFHLHCAQQHHPPGTPTILFCYHCSQWLQNRYHNLAPLEEHDVSAGRQDDVTTGTPGVVAGTKARNSESREGLQHCWGSCGPNVPRAL